MAGWACSMESWALASTPGKNPLFCIQDPLDSLHALSLNHDLSPDSQRCTLVPNPAPWIRDDAGARTVLDSLHASQHSAGEPDCTCATGLPARLAVCALQLPTSVVQDCGMLGGEPPPDGGGPELHAQPVPVSQRRCCDSGRATHATRRPEQSMRRSRGWHFTPRCTSRDCPCLTPRSSKCCRRSVGGPPEEVAGRHGGSRAVVLHIVVVDDLRS